MKLGRSVRFSDGEVPALKTITPSQKVNGSYAVPTGTRCRCNHSEVGLAAHAEGGQRARARDSRMLVDDHGRNRTYATEGTLLLGVLQPSRTAVGG